MAPIDHTASTGRRWRRVGGVLGVLLVAGAIALGVVYSNKGGHGSSATSAQPGELSPDTSDVGKVLDALKNLVGGDAAAPSTDTTTTVVPQQTASKDGVMDGASNMAGPAPAPAPGPQGLIQTMSAAAANSLGMKVCTPNNGAEFEAMVNGTTCTVILLTKSSSTPYTISKPMHVRSTKIVIGHPIDIPQLKPAKGLLRMFEVHPGGNLDMRFVMMIRPGGVQINDGRTRLIVGGMVFVRLGGNFRGSGLVFTDPEQTFEGFYNELTNPQNTKRTFGGYVLVLGGTFFCFGCQIVRNYPYGLPTINVFQVGRDFLVVAGLQVCVGCYHVAYTPYISTVNVGNAVAVLGGVAIRIGGGLISAGAATGQFGAGQGLFVGGGVLVDVGHQIQNTFAGLARASFGMSSVGAGVFILIAELENRAWAAACIFGAGQVYANGAGVLDKTGGEVANVQVSVIQALVGGSAYLGAGEMSIVGEQFARVGVTLSQNGLGWTFFNGAGNMDLIYVPSFVTQVARVQFGMGAEVFLGSGWYTNVNNTRWSHQVVNAGFPGYEGWIGLGGAVFIRSRTYSRRVVNYRVRPFLWVVNGRGVPGGQYSSNNLLVTKDGITVLKPQPTKGPKRTLEGAPRLLEMISNAAATYKRSTQADVMESSLLAVQSEADTRKIRPPRANHLARRLKAAMTEVHEARRLQGLPTPSFGLFGGLSAEKLIGAWKDAIADDPSKDLVMGADGIQRWPEYVYVGNNTKCFLCGMAPYPSSSHINPDPTQLPLPLTAEETSPGECKASDACAEGVAPQGTMSLLETAQAASPEPLALPGKFSKFQSSKYAKRVLRIMQADSSTGLATALPDHNILSYDVIAYCPPGQAAASCALSTMALKSGFQKYLHDRVGEDGAFKLTAAAGEIPAAVAKVVADLDPGFVADAASVASSPSGACGKGIKFSVYATTPDVETTQEVAQLLDAAAADPKAVLDEIQAAAGDEQHLCDLSIEKKGALFFPALTNPGAQKYYQQMYTGAGKLSAPSLFPDVTVVAASEVAPIQKAEAGRRYSVILENFSGPGDVTVELIQGTRSSGTVLTTVPGGMEKNKPVTLEFEAPEPLDGAGATRAYVRAYYTKIPGLFSQSEVFTLDSPAAAAAAPSA